MTLRQKSRYLMSVEARKMAGIGLIRTNKRGTPYIYIYIYIGGLGELVRLVRPPVTGRSASFRLRFRFVRAVRAVRAGEAKLRGHT